MAINIPLLDGYRLKSDSSNFILSLTEGERETYLGFFQTLQGAIEGFISMRIKGFNSTSIHSLVEAMKSLQTTLNTLLQPLNLVVVTQKSKEVQK